VNRFYIYFYFCLNDDLVGSWLLILVAEDVYVPSRLVYRDGQH
jgi:hypothetical protein